MAQTRQAKRGEGLGELDSGPADVAVRMCAVTRAELPQDRLIRFVRAPDGELVPDLAQRLPGRGVWVSGSRELIEKAIKNKVFGRSLQVEVKLPGDLALRLDVLLARRASDALALTNKAGDVIAGFQQVDAALDKDGVAVLLHGRDAAADGRGKLDRKFKAICRDKSTEAAIVDVLTIDEMSLALGRPSVVHAALIPGGLAQRFQREAERLVRYRSASASELPIEDPETEEPRTSARNEG